MELKKIIWATDLSENAKAALPYVSSLAQTHMSEVHVIYVLEPLGNFGAWYGDYDPAHVERLQALEKERAEEALTGLCEEHLKGCPLYVKHTAVGDPADQILRFAEAEKPDLIVLATKGRKGRFAVGSVAERLVRHSPVPVLTVPVKQQTTA
jgi:nucleotide-binding universal stress UspA family protein